MLLILTNLLVLTAQSSDAYAPVSSMASLRWSSSTVLHSSTAASVDSAINSVPSTSAADDNIAEENIKTKDLLSLDYIRSTLIRQEETIIFALIERAQFRQNDLVYKVGGVPGLGVPPGSNMSEDGEEELSFLDFMFTGTVGAIYHFSQC